jgi:hypothetical protein
MRIVSTMRPPRKTSATETFAEANRIARRAPLFAVLAIAGLVVGRAAIADPPDKRVPLDWKRDPAASKRRAVPAPPPAPERFEPPDAEPSRSARPSGTVSDVDQLATRAADEIAIEAARSWAPRTNWQKGFKRGITVALDDPNLSAWDHEEGVRFGRSDPRARALGDRLANDAAEEPARDEAEGRVRQQFTDLAAVPIRERAGTRGRLPRGGVPPFDGPFAVAPVLEQVFVAYPPTRAAGISPDGRRAIEAWRVEPHELARSDRAARDIGAWWKNPERAFSTWRDRQHRGSAWSRFTEPQRERFRDVFCDRFESAIQSADLRAAQAAWRIGFEDGWRYGAAINAEWSYRQGYADGFDLAVRETAAIAYPYAYAGAYASAYDAWFDAWSRSAHPGIEEVRLDDATGDGVFEPGEGLEVVVAVANYGGGAGAFDLIAPGTELGGPVTARVKFEGRGRAAHAQRLSLRIGDRVPPRTRTEIVLVMGEARAEATLYVSRPLAIDGDPAVDADRLGGRVTLRVAVSNSSRRDARGIVSVAPLTGKGSTQADDLGSIPAGGFREASVTFNGIHPLDLIGAESRWRASVARGGTVDDTREIRLAPVATDLSNPDLMDFMLALADVPGVSRSDVKDVRELMMERLRADWERAADGRGNPYKRDFESRGTETVLGELVRATDGGRRSFTSPQVFDGLNVDVAALCDELPGAHPLLRKWMKKLTQRLG